MKKIVVIVFIIQLISCSAPPEKASSNNTNPPLTDNWFRHKNLVSTKSIDIYDTSFHELDSTQKMQLIVPVIFDSQTDPLRIDYLIHFQNARLVSLQAKIYDFTPILVTVSGDDYDALFYILLDKMNKPISAVQIGGSGICSGPNEISDSLIKLCPMRVSTLKNSKIFTNVLTKSFIPDSIQHPSIFDSVTYVSEILSSGTIQTKRQDSVRYMRLDE